MNVLSEAMSRATTTMISVTTTNDDECNNYNDNIMMHITTTNVAE